MGMPAVLTQNGTGTSAVWIPDWMQVPFQVGISLVPSGAAGYATVVYTLDSFASQTATAGNVTWFTAILSGVATTVNFTTPCQGFRLNVGTSVATTTFAATFVQATFGR